MLVIDANIAISWLLRDGNRAEQAYAQSVLDALASDSAVMPSLWQLELTNIFTRAERDARLTEADVTAFLAALDQLPIDIDASIDVLAIAGLARHHQLTAYDAAYLDVAQRHGATLATLDKALRKAAAAAGVPVFVS